MKRSLHKALSHLFLEDEQAPNSGTPAPVQQKNTDSTQYANFLDKVIANQKRDVYSTAKVEYKPGSDSEGTIVIRRGTASGKTIDDQINFTLDYEKKIIAFDLYLMNEEKVAEYASAKSLQNLGRLVVARDLQIDDWKTWKAQYKGVKSLSRIRNNFNKMHGAQQAAPTQQTKASEAQQTQGAKSTFNDKQKVLLDIYLTMTGDVTSQRDEASYNTAGRSTGIFRAVVMGQKAEFIAKFFTTLASHSSKQAFDEDYVERLNDGELGKIYVELANNIGNAQQASASKVDSQAKQAPSASEVKVGSRWINKAGTVHTVTGIADGKVYCDSVDNKGNASSNSWIHEVFNLFVKNQRLSPAPQQASAPQQPSTASQQAFGPTVGSRWINGRETVYTVTNIDGEEIHWGSVNKDGRKASGHNPIKVFNDQIKDNLLRPYADPAPTSSQRRAGPDQQANS